MDKEDVDHLYNGILVSEKNEIIFVATWLDLEIIILSKVSRKVKASTIRYHLYVDITFMKQ